MSHLLHIYKNYTLNVAYKIITQFVIVSLNQSQCFIIVGGSKFSQVCYTPFT
jgi:hypothetical protein